MILDKCESYHECYNRQECWGTKEREECTCNGDPSKCNFYLEKRKEIKMNTAEMWLKAQENGKTYRYMDLIYNRDTGFINNLGDEWENLEETLSEFMSIDEWEEENTIMTKAQAEEKFGIIIIGD